VKRTLYRLDPRVLCLLMAFFMVVQTPLAGQSGGGLAIQVLEASEGQNIVGQELPPIRVRVMDRTGRVINGASVLFAAPEEGPTGHFLPNESQITVVTDPQGMATAPRFRTNSTVGEYDIQIVASYKDAASRVLIPQSNVLKKKSSHKKLFILSAVIGGAAAAAFAAKGGNSGPASSALGALATPTITLGESSSGAPTVLAIAPSVGTTTSGTLPSATSTSSTSGSSTSSGQSLTPPPQTQAPSISSVCANMPPNSNRRECR